MVVGHRKRKKETKIEGQKGRPWEENSMPNAYSISKDILTKPQVIKIIYK